MMGKSDIAARLRRRGRDETGVVAILVAVLLVVFLASAGLAVDLGSYYQAQSQAQNAADAGALAAAHDLSSSPSSATSDGTTIATTNFPGASVTVSEPTATTAKVIVNAVTPTYFGKILGLTKEDVSATAVAGATSAGPANAAIFAADSSCGGSSGVTVEDMSGVTVNGPIISQGAVNFTGVNQSTFNGTVHYGQSCSAPAGDGSNGNNNSPFTSVGDQTGFTAWPEPFTGATSACTRNFTGNVTFDGGYAWTPGVYCDLSGTITIQNQNGANANVTFIAKAFDTVNISGLNITPYYPSLAFYQTGSGTCTIEDVSLGGGAIFVPDGTAYVENMNHNTSGFIEAQDVIFSGDNNDTFTGDGTSGGGTVSLLQ